MYKESLRFLALNAVLHGYSLASAFEGKMALLADTLEMEEKDAAQLCESVDGLPEVSTVENSMVRVFLNYFRNPEYAFVAMGTNAVPLSTFVLNDYYGQVNEELRSMFLMQLIRDVTQNEMYVEPFIADGVLHCTPDDFQTVQQAMLEAYQLYMSGPVGTPKGLVESLRRYTSLERYDPMKASVLVRILRQMVRAKKKPTIYQRTMLLTPDLMDVYQHTGCIMAFRDSTHTSVHWLLDVSGTEGETAVLTADMSSLKTYLLRDVKDLSNIKATRSIGDGTKILFPEVV